MHYLLTRSPALMRFRSWLPALCLFAVFATLALAPQAQAQLRLKSSSGPSAQVQTPRVHAELVAQAPDGITAGKTLWLGLYLQHQPDWHTYWRNAGDSGLPTELHWQLPAGMVAGPIEWPVPQSLRVGPLLNYGYENQILLPVKIQVSPDFQAPASGVVDIGLRANWLICRVECIPEDGEFRLQLPVTSSTVTHAAAFAQAQALQAQAVTPAAQAQVSGERLQLRVSGLPAALQGQSLELYPEAPDTLEHAAVLGKDWQQSWQGDVWTADMPLSDMRGQTPERLDLVVALPPQQRAQALAQGQPVGWRTSADVQGQWTAAALATVSPALAAALEANQANASAAQAVAPSTGSSVGATALWAALLGGLLGGLILNLMPCVFPVLAIKVLGFAQHGQDRRAQRLGGLAYTAGVVLSFLALGSLLLVLRAAGEQLGWGFQLQSPVIVSLLALLFTLLGLNLAGLFEMGQMLPRRWANARAKNPVSDAFLSGVLAVAIASPCTAPFMGASLGFAIDMPAIQALAVFLALGLGMALPYLLAAYVPAVVAWLPRPGAWMDTFRKAMAFPMFATVVWLVWVLGQQSGIDGAVALLALLLCLSALVWSLTLSGRSRWLLAGLSALISVALLSTAAPLLVQDNDSPAPQAQAGAMWQPWSEERVQALQATGQSVFVDFTAAWCVTCQVNKRTTLNHPDVIAAFEQHQVATLRADWTRRDPRITEALQALGRSGVPVYVLLQPGQAPVVLSELLSKQEVLQALARL